MTYSKAKEKEPSFNLKLNDEVTISIPEIGDFKAKVWGQDKNGATDSLWWCFQISPVLGKKIELLEEVNDDDEQNFVVLDDGHMKDLLKEDRFDSDIGTGKYNPKKSYLFVNEEYILDEMTSLLKDIRSEIHDAPKEVVKKVKASRKKSKKTKVEVHEEIFIKASSIALKRPGWRTLKPINLKPGK